MNILLIDLSSIAHPLYHISASDPDPNATSIKTVERVRALASGQPHVGVCVEGGRSFRKDIDASYKANRPESDAALQDQIALAIDVLRADGFPILQAHGFEADDTAATAAVALAFAKHDVTIASADKDLLQLIDSRVTVKSLKDGSLIDRDAVAAKFGVYPEQFLDFLALCGDASDNIKGAKGIGKGRAAEILKRFGSLDAAIEAAKDGTDATTTALQEFKPRLETVRMLLRLRTDAPIDIEPLLKERMPLDVAEFDTEEIAADDETMKDPHYQTSVRMGQEAINASAPAAAVAQLPARANGTFTLQADTDPAPIEWERQLEPRNMQQMKRLAIDLFASRHFSAYGSAAGVLSTILAGRELGLPAMAALRAFHIIESKPVMAADFIRALVLQSGVVEYFRCTERTPERATFVAKRKGDPEISLTFTIDDARRAWSKKPESWESSGWGRNPADMCVARAGAKLARLVAPDVVSGLYAPEEFE